MTAARDDELGIAAVAVTKRFGGEVALAPTDLRALPGRISLLVGQNGTGKSTMLRILGTLVHPDGGTVRINGFDPVRQGAHVRKEMALALVNERSVFWRLSVLENVELFARLRRIPKEARRQRCLGILEELGLDQLVKRDAYALSAGQRQRLVLARTLVGDAAVLLIDEPLRGLDPDAEQLVVSALARRAGDGATVLVATPSESEIEAFSVGTVSYVGQSTQAEVSS